MAADTVSAQEILFQIARDAGETVSEFVSPNPTSTTVFVARGALRDPHITYKSALARIEGKGIRTVTAWDPQLEQFTVNSAFSSAVAENDQVEIMGWDATRRRMMFDAINASIRKTWGMVGRETKGTLGLTFTVNQAQYNLSSTIGALWRVMLSNSDGSYNERAERDLWRVGGEPGALVLNFLDNGNVFMPNTYTGEVIYGWYLQNEPEITSESDTVRLPMNWFNWASYLYVAKSGAPQPQEGQDPRVVQANWNAKVGQLKVDAEEAEARLKRLRTKRPMSLRYNRKM